MKKKESLIFRLLVKDVSIDDCFTDSFKEKAHMFTIGSWKNVPNSKVYTGNIYSKQPKWKNSIQSGCDNVHEDLNSTAPGGVIFLPVRERIMAICFGQIHIYLKDSSFESKFGLKIALNSVPRGEVRTMNVTTLGDTVISKNFYASKNSDYDRFGLDKFRDLTQVAGGTPLNQNLGMYLEGKNSLSINCNIHPNEYHQKCHELYDCYQLETYKNDYPWFDNNSIVTDKTEIDRLDSLLFEEIKNLRAGENSSLHFYPPDISLTDAIFKIKGLGRYSQESETLEINDYINLLNSKKFNGNIAEIKKHTIECRSISCEATQIHPIYKCFVLEIYTDSDIYILYFGNWHRVSPSFKNEIEEYYNKIPKIELVKKTTCKNEKELIKTIEDTRNDLVKLDCTKINPTGVKNANIEPCDFYSNRQFIHLKFGYSSAQLNHLWAQGLASILAFISDKKFRDKLQENIKLSKKNIPYDFSPKALKQRDNFSVVYGIMRKRNSKGNIDIPFFSKISLKTTVERIIELGFNVFIELIEIT